MNNKWTILILTLINLCACARFQTKGDLELISIRPLKGKPNKTVQISRVHYFKSGSDKFSASFNKLYLSDIVKQTQKSNRFRGVTVLPSNFESIDMMNFMETDEKEIFIEDMYDGVSDYHIIIESESNHPGHHGGGYMHWGFIHFLSLGFIPIYEDNSLDWLVTVIDAKKDRTIQQFEIKDTSSSWYWTPLVFFNGFHLLSFSQEGKNQVHQNAMTHVINRLEVPRIKP